MSTSAGRVRLSDRIIDVAADRAAALARAVEALRDGQLVVVPTDTVYGVAADAFSPTGTRRIFGAKRVSRRSPLPVLVRNPKQLQGLSPAVPEAAELLMAAYWPGPLTVVIPSQPELSWDLGDARGVVAVRMPLDELALDLIRAVGPLAVTSANRSGNPAATTAAAAHEQLGDRVAAYLDDGVRPGTGTSTIVDVTRGTPVVLREGLVPAQDVLAVARGELDPIEAGNRLLAPAAPDTPDDAAGAGDAGDDATGDDRAEAEERDAPATEGDREAAP